MIKKLVSKTTAKSSSKKKSKLLNGPKDESLHFLIEKGKKDGHLTYEEIMEYADKNGLTEQDTEQLFKVFDKEHIELVTADEIEQGEPSIEHLDIEHDSASPLKTKLESSLSFEAEDL